MGRKKVQNQSFIDEKSNQSDPLLAKPESGFISEVEQQKDLLLLSNAIHPNKIARGKDVKKIKSIQEEQLELQKKFEKQELKRYQANLFADNTVSEQEQQEENVETFIEVDNDEKQVGGGAQLNNRYPSQDSEDQQWEESQNSSSKQKKRKIGIQRQLTNKKKNAADNSGDRSTTTTNQFHGALKFFTLANEAVDAQKRKEQQLKNNNAINDQNTHQDDYQIIKSGLEDLKKSESTTSSSNRIYQKDAAFQGQNGTLNIKNNNQIDSSWLKQQDQKIENLQQQLFFIQNILLSENNKKKNNNTFSTQQEEIIAAATSMSANYNRKNNFMQQQLLPFNNNEQQQQHYFNANNANNNNNYEIESLANSVYKKKNAGGTFQPSNQLQYQQEQLQIAKSSNYGGGGDFPLDAELMDLFQQTDCTTSARVNDQNILKQLSEQHNFELFKALSRIDEISLWKGSGQKNGNNKMMDNNQNEGRPPVVAYVKLVVPLTLNQKEGIFQHGQLKLDAQMSKKLCTILAKNGNNKKIM